VAITGLLYALKRFAYPAFATAFDEEVSRHLCRDDLSGVIYSDGELSRQELSLETAQLLRDASPWGQGFPAPVFEGDFNVVDRLVKDAIAQGLNPNEVIQGALTPGMEEVGRRFRSNEYFIPEVLKCAKAMNMALGTLKPLMVGDTSRQTIGKFLIGTVEGDVHDIGKNLVAMMLEASGFEVIDLGVGVPAAQFVAEARSHRPDIVGMSALLSTTIVAFEDVIQAFQDTGLRDQFKIMVGGAPVTQEYADHVGADGYAPNASEAVEKAKQLL
jgi:5-methyltetrahydrofolate--homocysteine methyltransferase